MASQTGQDYFTEQLAQELLDEIFGYLDLSHRLKLRLVFNKAKAEEKLLPLLLPTLSNLFVSPTRLSLRNFQGICKSRFFQKHVRNVIFLQTVVGPGAPQFKDSSSTKKSIISSSTYACERYRDSMEQKEGISLTRRDAQRSLELYQGLVEEHYMHYDSCSKPTGENALRDVYLILRASLARLTNLMTVKVCSQIDVDGLNGSCLLYSKDYERSRAERGLYTLQQDAVGRAAAVFTKGNFSWQCTNTLFEAIHDSGIKLRSLMLGNSHRDQINAMIQSDTHCDEFILEGVFRNLRKLTICCFDYTDEDFDLCTQFWRHAANDAVALSELTLYTGDTSEEWHTPWLYERALDNILEAGNFPSLRVLRIVGNHTQPAYVDGEDIERFFATHWESLEEVDISGMMFSDAAKPDDSPNPGYQEDVCLTITRVLDAAAAKLQNLKSFHMKVHRRDEHIHQACRIGNAPPGGPCKGTCEQYLQRDGKWLHRSKLDALAVELGVTLKDDSWEFGEYVMRTKT